MIVRELYQAGMFMIACVCASILLAWLLHAWRCRQVIARTEARLDGQLSERRRIARELHDTFLQSVQGLILKLQAAIERIPLDDPARGMMEQALSRADDTLAEGRERVLNLRQSIEVRRDLPQTLLELTKQLVNDLAPEQFEVSLKVGGSIRVLHPLATEEIQAIVREAVTNTLRHACTLRIALEVVYARGEIVVRVIDHGRGFRLETSPPLSRIGHWGLIGMQERARRISGHVEIVNHPGAGTLVALTIPARIAFKRFWQDEATMPLPGPRNRSSAVWGILVRRLWAAVSMRSRNRCRETA